MTSGVALLSIIFSGSCLCVKVGVDVNSASETLLARVPGLNRTTARNIFDAARMQACQCPFMCQNLVDNLQLIIDFACVCSLLFRDFFEQPFVNRNELQKRVKGLGSRGYQQCAGFLFVRDGNEPLDTTRVESLLNFHI